MPQIKFKFMSLLLVIFAVFTLYSQKGIVYYGFINALPSGNSKGPDSNAYLIFNKELSYYVTAKDSLEKAESREQQKTFTNDDGGGIIYNGTKVSPQGDQVVYDFKNNILLSNILYRKQIYVKEIPSKISWKLEKETKKVGNFNCKKATTNFRGRSYVAWYTAEIPVSYGPWKLQGLPGLILEAYDVNKFVYWYFKSVEYPTKIKDNPAGIRKSKSERKVDFLTFEEFKKVQVEEQKRVTEKNMILKQSYPDIQIQIPKLSVMFIECD
jgi:GLPGLI family protein